MGMKLTFTNLFSFFGSIAPLLLAFFLIMVSLFNQNAKGFVYLGGILVASVLNILLSNLFQKRTEGYDQNVCSIIDFPFQNTYFTAPAYNTMFITFTIVYLLLPMIFNNQINFFLLTFLFFILLSDSFSKIMRGCHDILDILSGFIFGAFMGFAWFAIFHYTKNNNLLYYSDFVSNNVVCERPKRQTFKCAVYKNGKLIKNL